MKTDDIAAKYPGPRRFDPRDREYVNALESALHELEYDLANAREAGRVYKDQWDKARAQIERGREMYIRQAELDAAELLRVQEILRALDGTETEKP